MLRNGERQVAPELSGIRRDHVARYEFAVKLLGTGRRVVDGACGVGYGAAILADAGNSVLALDRSADAVAYGQQHYARPAVSMFNQDLTRLQLSENFDAAVCFETIEHLEDPLPMLQELCRSAPALIASVPNEAVFPHGGCIKFHFRHYTRAEFEDLLNRAGYRVIAWYGQAGPESEVAPDIEGRTLIAAAVRAGAESPFKPIEWHSLVEQIPPPAIAAIPDHVAIVGLGPSCVSFFELTRRLGGVSAYCDEVWGLNAIGDVLRCDRIFHMDDLKVQEVRAAAKPEGNIAAMVRWLKTHPGPVYTSIVRAGYAGLVAFPLEEVLNRSAGSNGGAPYFNSTAAYAVAYAVHIGVKRISLFGVDYTMPNAHHGEQGRACVEFWLGIAAARGIAISVPDTSSLMDACAQESERLYGYDCVDVHLSDQDDGTVKVKMMERESVPSASEMEARYDHTKHPNRLLRVVA